MVQTSTSNGRIRYQEYRRLMPTLEYTHTVPIKWIICYCVNEITRIAVTTRKLSLVSPAGLWVYQICDRIPHNVWQLICTGKSRPSFSQIIVKYFKRFYMRFCHLQPVYYSLLLTVQCSCRFAHAYDFIPVISM